MDHRLTTIWKSVLFKPCQYYCMVEKTIRDLRKDAACCFKEILETAPHKTAAVGHVPHKLSKLDTQSTTGEVKNS